MAFKHRLFIRPFKATKDVATDNHEDFQGSEWLFPLGFFRTPTAKLQEETENRGVELDARLYNAESQVDSNLSDFSSTRIKSNISWSQLLSLKWLRHMHLIIECLQVI